MSRYKLYQSHLITPCHVVLEHCMTLMGLICVTLFGAHVFFFHHSLSFNNTSNFFLPADFRFQLFVSLWYHYAFLFWKSFSRVFRVFGISLSLRPSQALSVDRLSLSQRLPLSSSLISLSLCDVYKEETEGMGSSASCRRRIQREKMNKKTKEKKLK
jgi:hypothetical protein